MKICKKCGNEIPGCLVVDGIRRNLCARKYCFTCSPFNKHNTRRIENVPPEPTGFKYCVKCKCVLPVKEFGYFKQLSRLWSYCKKCRAKQNMLILVARKKQAIEYKGGKCCICGYNKYYGALDFHHLDPKKKEYLFDRSNSLERQKKELDKTVLVCSNCHREVHAGLVNVPI